MERNLLIDLGDSPDSVNVLTGGPLDSSINAVSHNGMANNAGSNYDLRSDISSEVETHHIQDKRKISPFGSPVLKFKAQSVDSLAVIDSKGFCSPLLLGCPLTPRRPQSVDMERLAGGDSSLLLSPFASPRPKSTPSLPAVNLLDAETTKILSPFGWTPIRNNRMTMNEAIQIEDIPIGDLIQVKEPEQTLPDDMFDINTLGRKQLEYSEAQPSANPKPTVKMILPSLTSIGSEDMSSNDTLNKGFMETVSDESNLFPTPDDSVFEEAQNLSKFLQKMATEASIVHPDSIEDEDGSIVFECPEWRDDDAEIDCSKVKQIEVDNKKLEIYSQGNAINKEGMAMNEYCRKYSSAFSDIVGASPESGGKSSSFSSSISTISPSPLSSDRVENVKLKARSFIGSHFNVGSLKLRASSCSSVPSSKPGPLKALVPVGQVFKSNVCTPNTLSVHKRSFGTETPRLQVMTSPVEGISVARRMSSTPKPHTPDNVNSNKNKLNLGSSLKKHVGNKVSSIEAKKSTGTSGTLPRSLSSGKLQESQKVGANDVESAKSSARSTLPRKFSVGSPAVEASVLPLRGGRHEPSPLLQRKISNSPSSTKTPSRSISTGSLASTSSLKKKNSSPQTPSLQSQGRSISISSKLPLCYTGRPLTEASVNSPAKHNSPLHKFVSKFRRNLGPKELKENVRPM